MIDPLTFTIGVAVVLLGGGIYIGKSALPESQKLMSLLLIMTLFALVSIVNEVKKKPPPQPPVTVVEIVDCTKKFFVNPEHSHESFLQIEDPVELLNNTLSHWDPSRPDTLHLTFLYTENKPEIDLGFREYTRLLHKNKQPALYLDLAADDFTLRDFMNSLKVPNLESVDVAIQKFNKRDKYPVIFVNNAENAVTFDETHANSFTCSLCEYLVDLFENETVHIILASDDILTRDYLKAGTIEILENNNDFL